MDQGVLRRDIARQGRLVHSAEGAEVCPKRRTGPCTGVAGPFASAVPLVLTRPFGDAVAPRGLGWGAAVRARPCIGVQDRALHRDLLGEPGRTRTPVRMVAAPQPWRPRLAREHTADGGTLMGRGSRPLPLVGTPPGRLSGSALGRTCFPQRSGSVQRPHTWCRPSPEGVRARASGLGAAAAASGAASVRPPRPGRGVLWTRPWRSRAAPGPRWPGAAGFSPRWSRSAASRRHRRLGREKPEPGLARGRGAARRAHRAGIADHVEGGDVPARSCSRCPPITRRSDSLSWP